MGGKEGNRGYLVQTIVALLESLDDDSWNTVTIEPGHDSEFIDVLWDACSHAIPTVYAAFLSVFVISSRLVGMSTRGFDAR